MCVFFFYEKTVYLMILNGNVGCVIYISLKFVSKGIIDNTAALIHLMAWHELNKKQTIT